MTRIQPLYKFKTKTQKEKSDLYQRAVQGDGNAQRLLHKDHGYQVITVNGKQVNLQEKFGDSNWRVGSRLEGYLLLDKLKAERRKK